MPFIVLKRGDVPAGVLQVLDLWPNESQRNPVYQPPGQTKYVDPILNDTVATITSGGVITTAAEYRGLAAYLLTNVNDGTGAAAAGTLTVSAAAATAGDTVTIGGVVLTAVAGARTPGSNDFSIASGTNNGIATEITAALNDPANDFTSLVEATANAAVVELDAVTVGTAGNAITLASSDGVFIAVSGATMAGGVDADALTAAEANTSAEDILGNLIGFDDLTQAAVDADLTAMNAEMAAGELTSDQFVEVMQILAGREYVVPAGTQIQAASAFNVQPAVDTPTGPRFTGGFRSTYATDNLMLSVSQGALSLYMSADFTYKGVGGAQGEAIVVYNDDGTLYTV